MTGEIKELKQPASSKNIGDVTPMEWFKARFDDKSGIAMVICPKRAIVKTDAVLFIDKDGALKPLTVDTMKTYGGEFLGYLTAEESVTIYGSLDPDWVEPTPPEPKFCGIGIEPTDPLDLHQVSMGIPFYYRWVSEHINCIGIKLQPKFYAGSEDYILLRVSRVGTDQGHIRGSSHTPRIREFQSYVPPDEVSEVMARLRKHRNAHECRWEGVDG